MRDRGEEGEMLIMLSSQVDIGPGIYVLARVWSRVVHVTDISPGRLDPRLTHGARLRGMPIDVRCSIIDRSVVADLPRLLGSTCDITKRIE
jgi:hypothetical protein